MNRDNQQDTPTEGEIAWLAGVIECDGSVMLSAHMRKEEPEKVPKIGVEIKLYNTDGGIIAQAITILDKLNVGYYLVERPQKSLKMDNGKTYGDLTKPMLSVIVKKMTDTLRLATILEPWMFGEKRHRLRVMINFLISRYNRTGFKSGTKIGYSTDELRCVTGFYRDFVKNPSANKALVEGLLRD